MESKYMTVRELIEKLLRCKMDDEVCLFTTDPIRPDCRGVAFAIKRIDACYGIVEIQFDDWRHGVDKRERGETA